MGRPGYIDCPEGDAWAGQAILNFYARKGGSYPMRVGQLSESDAVDALRLPFYSSRHARGSHVQGNQFDLGNTR